MPRTEGTSTPEHLASADGMLHVDITPYSLIRADDLREALSVVAPGDQETLQHRGLWFSVEDVDVEGSFPGFPGRKIDLIGAIHCPLLRTLFLLNHQGTQFFDHRLAKTLSDARALGYTHCFVLVERSIDDMTEMPAWFQTEGSYAGYIASMMARYGTAPLFLPSRRLMTDVIARTLYKVALHSFEGRMMAPKRRRSRSLASSP